MSQGLTRIAGRAECRGKAKGIVVVTIPHEISTEPENTDNQRLYNNANTPGHEYPGVFAEYPFNALDS